MTPKAIFVDVDGTLLTEEGRVPDSARDAIRAARERGHLVFLCTGRSLGELWGDVLAVGFDGIVAAAGAYVEVGGEVLAHRTVPVAELRALVDYLTERAVEFKVDTNHAVYGSPGAPDHLRATMAAFFGDSELGSEQTASYSRFADVMITGEDVIRDDVNKVSFLHSEVTIDEIRARFEGIFDVIPSSVEFFGANSGEMSVAGITKATGIATVLEHLGIAREDTVAFGDSHNDLDMLAFVHVGVAMDSAHPDVIAVADRTTPSPDDHGIHAGFKALGLI